MRSSIITLGAFLFAAVAAQPHGRHGQAHADKHAKRKLVVVTDYVDITETVLLTATVWVDGKGNTISPPVTGDSKSTARGKPVTRSRTASPGIFNEPAKTSVAPVETTQAPPPPPVEPTSAPQPEPTPSQAPAPPPVEEVKPASTTTVQVSSISPEPVPSPAYVAPVVPSPEPQPEPAPSPAYVAPVVPSPEPAPSPAYVAPVAAAPEPQAQAATAPAPAKDVGGPCSAGSPCTGDVTFYQAGLGACGETHDGLAEAVVALPHGMMGTQSNGNPFCGRTVSITKNGKTATAKVVDKCMGCKDGDLDLSENAFAALGIDQTVGRTTAEWYFTS